MALSIAAMTVGGLIYVLWRPDSLIMFSWFAAIGVDQVIADARAWAQPLRDSVPRFVHDSLPQALWLFSGCLAIHSVWRNWRYRGELLWITLVLTLAFGLELGQALGLMGGVFDYLDLALLIVAFLAACSVALAGEQATEVKRGL